jgi:hypothetical protein
MNSWKGEFLMTNTKKKKNNTKKLLGAIGMLTVSAAMLVSSTFAWFSMNKDVKALGMQTTAKAEDGIAIAAYTNNGQTAPAASAFKDSANAYNLPSSTVQLLPTFTNDGTNWYHSWSKEVDDGQIYGDDGYTAVDNDATNGNYYYLMNKFQIKSITADKAIYVKKVEVATPANTKAYDESIRVLIKMGSTIQIFNKDGTTWAAETAAASTNGNDAITTDVTASPTVVNNAIATIGTAATTGTDVEIYVYYDGEDPACKTTNIDFDQVTINVTFTSDQTSILPAASAGP